jgi:hypothetical protein
MCFRLPNWDTTRLKIKMFRRETSGKAQILVIRVWLRKYMRTRGVTGESNPRGKIGTWSVHCCPIGNAPWELSLRDQNRSVFKCPFEGKNSQSNFKTGAINRSATPPGEVVRLIFALARRWARWIEQPCCGAS